MLGEKIFCCSVFLALDFFLNNNHTYPSVTGVVRLSDTIIDLVFRCLYKKTKTAFISGGVAGLSERICLHARSLIHCMLPRHRQLPYHGSCDSMPFAFSVIQLPRSLAITSQFYNYSLMNLIMQSVLPAGNPNKIVMVHQLNQCVK